MCMYMCIYVSNRLLPSVYCFEKSGFSDSLYYIFHPCSFQHPLL